MRDIAALSETERANRALVLDFYEKAIGRWDYAAAEPLLGEPYVQHSPSVDDGRDGLRRFIESARERLAGAPPVEIKRVLTDGDMVMLHVSGRYRPDVEGVAIIDLFRVADGKIVEHWDVIQELPAERAHANGAF